MSRSYWTAAAAAAWIAGIAAAGALGPLAGARYEGNITADGEAEMLASCKKEIQELHAFFQGWFRGELEDSDEAYARFAGVLGPEFEIVSPAGQRTSRIALLAALRASHGKDDASLRIWTQAERVRGVGSDLFVSTYEEWQAKGGEERSRISTAVFRRSADTPNGVEWLHVHETWIDGE